MRQFAPYHGNKAGAAPLIWAALGDVPNYVEPFSGLAGNLFGRPCYGVDFRDKVENGDHHHLRIVLASYDTITMPPTWRCIPWKSHSGRHNADRERLWLSPHCLHQPQQQGLLL